jgi:transketolase
VEELKTLRKNDSRLQGHPIATYLPGLDASAGPGDRLRPGSGHRHGSQAPEEELQGWACPRRRGDQRGIVWETSLAASKYKLDNFIAIVDKNNLQLDGTTDEVLPMEPLDDKFRAFGFEVYKMDGHDMADVLTTLTKAKRNTTGKPVCVIAYTVKGKGVSFMEHQLEWHGKAPNEEQCGKACEEIEGDEA